MRFPYTIYNGDDVNGGTYVGGRFDLGDGESRYVGWGQSGGYVEANSVEGWDSSFSCSGATASDYRAVFVNPGDSATCTVTHTRRAAPGAVCGDGKDNDGDTAVDMADLGCESTADDSELGPVPTCDAYSVDRYTTLDVPREEGLFVNDSGQGLTAEVTYLTFAARKLRLDTTTGAFTYDASANDATYDWFTYRVRDTFGETSRSVRVGIYIDQPVPDQVAQLCGATSACTLKGTASRDNLTGTPGRDVICGFGGDDSISGLDGNDELRGGAGNDRILAGPGNDKSVGGPGDDAIRSGEGSDTLEGEAGDDLLGGGAGADKLLGGEGDDTAIYLSAPRSIVADLGRGTATGEGTDKLVELEALRGSRNADRLKGSSSADELRGEAGDDELIGLSGSDLLQGGAGRDAIDGSGGADVLAGGNGSDSGDGGAGRDLCFSLARAKDCEGLPGLGPTPSGDLTGRPRASVAGDVHDLGATRKGRLCTKPPVRLLCGAFEHGFTDRVEEINAFTATSSGVSTATWRGVRPYAICVQDVFLMRTTTQNSPSAAFTALFGDESTFNLQVQKPLGNTLSAAYVNDNGKAAPECMFRETKFRSPEPRYGSYTVEVNATRGKISWVGRIQRVLVFQSAREYRIAQAICCKNPLKESVDVG
jgi:Ca2+-binding RTX toxin-like protein